MNLKNNKGHTLYYFLIFTLVLVLSWAMMLNIAKLIRDRMVMQNMTDNIALSIATHKARTMNIVGGLNYALGAVLKIGTRAEFVQLPNFGTDLVAAYPTGDRKPGSDGALSKDVAKLKKSVEEIQRAQEDAMEMHLLYLSETYAKLLAKGYIVSITPSPAEYMPTAPIDVIEKYFGLKRNTKGITYKKTENVFSMFSWVYTKMIALEILNTFSEVAGKIPLLGSIFDNVDSFKKKLEEYLGFNLEDFFEAPVYATSDKSWYITDDNFYDQKTKVMITKMSNEANRPLFARLLGISYPAQTFYSAAAIYNTKGTMFPQNESELLGTFAKEKDSLFGAKRQEILRDLGKIGDFFKNIPALPLEDMLLFAPSALQNGIMLAELANRGSYAGAAIGIAITLYIEANCLNTLYKWLEGRKDSPINNYLNAKDGGWAAHLVPYSPRDEEQTREEDTD